MMDNLHLDLHNANGRRMGAGVVRSSESALHLPGHDMGGLRLHPFDSSKGRVRTQSGSRRCFDLRHRHGRLQGPLQRGKLPPQQQPQKSLLGTQRSKIKCQSVFVIIY